MSRSTRPKKTRRPLALVAALIAALAVGATWSSLSASRASAAALPDLVVTSVAVPEVIAGAPVAFSATVKNRGTAPTPDGVIIGVQFQVDGTGPLTWNDTYAESLAPGDSVTLLADGGQAGPTWTATGGTHSVRAWVDDVARLAESNDSNNQRSASFTVADAPAAEFPDLVVTSVQVPSVTPGSPVAFRATLKNQGTASTPDGVVVGVQFQVDGSGPLTWNDTDTESLAPGASVTLTADGGQAGPKWKATAGTHVVRAWVDDVARIAELDDANNVLWTTFAVSDGTPGEPTTDPPPTTIPAPSGKGARFGINGQQFPLTDLASWRYWADRAAELGMKWIRGDWAPERVPPLGSSWAASDAAVDYAQRRGLEVLVELHGSASSPPSGSVLAAEGAALVAHYKQRNPGAIGAVEVWNEPNLAQFWSPVDDGAAYAAVVKAVYPAVKAADPDMTVLAGAMAPGPGTPQAWGYPQAQFLTNAYDAGMQGSFDALSYHAYPVNDAPGSIDGALAALDQLHWIMAVHGDGAKQIWATEVGASTAAMSEAAQATTYSNYIASELSGARPWLGVMIFHNARDTGREQFGIYRADNTPKPVAATIQSLLLG